MTLRPVWWWLALSTCAAVSPRPTPETCAQRHAAHPHEVVERRPSDELVWREETFEVPGERDGVVAAFLAEPLETFIHTGTAQLPAVDHTEPLTAAHYPAPGSIRLVCLRDGEMADEEVLSQTPTGLRYAVTHYSSSTAAPVRYGLGEFRFVALPGARTQVTWRYSFSLRADGWPGSLGGLGRWLFRVGFLESDYAAFMRATASDIQAWATRLNQTSSAHGANEALGVVD
jgi:hypothetical protein